MAETIHIPKLEILIQRRKVPGLELDLIDASVTESLGMASEFSFSLYTFDRDEHQLTWVDSANMTLGSSVEVKMGYQDIASSFVSLVTGDILTLDLEYQVDSPLTLKVTGQDIRHRLARGEKSRKPFKLKSEFQIIREILSEYSLTLGGTDPATPREYAAQRNVSDLAFINQLASDAGAELIMTGTTLTYQPLVMSEPDLILSPSTGLLSFSSSVTSSGRYASVEVRGAEKEGAMALVGKASITEFMPGLVSGDRFYNKTCRVRIRSALNTQAEVDKAAKIEAARLASDYLTASCTSFGSTKIRPGKVVRIEDLGTRFSQDYIVTKASHTYSAGGLYRTSFTLQGNLCQT